MYVATEVATKDHVFEALKAGIDILWIGARTTVNPFAVQEIADALKGVDIPVLIKNPVNPDLELWIGACTIRTRMRFDHQAVEAQVHCLLRQRSDQFALTTDMAGITEDRQVRHTAAKFDRYMPQRQVTVLCMERRFPADHSGCTGLCCQPAGYP